MVYRHPLVHPEWVAACVVPRAVAPHGNFTQETVTPFALLALLVDFSPNDFDRYSDKVLSNAEPWEKRLVDDAAGVQLLDTLEPASQRLAEFSGDRSLPLGARTAAALWSSIGLCELDRDEEAIEVLDNLQNGIDAKNGNGSLRLCKELLVLHSALRSYELGDRVTSVRSLEKLQMYPAAEDFESFTTSPSIAWSAARVQQDVVEMIAANSLKLRSRIEGFETDTWADVVRSRPTYPASQLRSLAAARDSEFRDESYRVRVDSSRRILSIASARLDPSLRAMGPIYVAEMSADAFGVVEARRARAKLLLLGVDVDADMGAEAIRLWRRSRENNELRTAVQWLRSEGPLESLAMAGERVLEMADRRNGMGQLGLEILSGAAAVLSDDQMHRTLNYVNRFWTSGESASSIRTDVAVRTVSRMLPWPEGSEAIAQWCLQLLDNADDSSYVSRLSGIVGNLSWDRIDEVTRQQWIAFAERSSNRDQAVLAANIYTSLLGTVPAAILSQCSAGERIVLAVQSGMSLDELEGGAETAIENCIESLSSVRSDAARGSFGFGGIDDGEVAVALLEHVPNQHLWDAIADFLSDPNLMVDQKSRALDRLASSSKVPHALLESLRERWGDVATTSPGFGEVASAAAGAAMFPSLLRFAGRHQMVHRSELITAVVELTGGDNTPLRIEGARSIPFVVSDSRDSDWAHILLMQLCHDVDPVVRAEAAKSLASLLDHVSSVQDLAIETVLGALRAGGVLIPLFAVHGLQRLYSARVPLAVNLIDEIGAMRDRHAVRVVREASGVLVDTAKSVAATS